MTPATKKARAKGEPITVEAKGTRGGKQKVTVTQRRGATAADHRITVEWICGDTRIFTIETLREQIGYMNDVAAGRDIWLNMDAAGGGGAYGQHYWARLRNGDLTANSAMEDNGTVPWLDLQRALQTAIAELLS